MARVKIKQTSPTTTTKIKLLQTLSLNLIYATKIIPVNDGYIVLTRDDDDLDKVFLKDCLQALQQENFTPILPPELRAKRSVVVFKVEDHIYERSEDEIKEEMENQNDWIDDGIDSLYKFPRNKMMKITFKHTATAKKATEQGILCFNMSIPHHTIKKEEFIQINTCLKCYEIEKHFTSQCPREKNFKICSECGSTEHTWRDCRAENKQCLNCNGQHSTMANKCPEIKKIRKEELKEKRENKQT